MDDRCTMAKLTVLLKSLFPSQCFNERAKAGKTRVPSPTSGPTVIVSHGAFNTSWHYQPFIDALQQNTRIQRILVPQQSSSGPSPPDNSFDSDIEMLNDTIRNELQTGHDVLLICHSYGSIPGCEALADLPEKALDGGRLGRILGIVFVSAFVAEAGMSLITSKMAGRADWVRTEGPLSHVNNPAKTLFTQTTPPSLQALMVQRLVPQASASFLTVTKHETWKDHMCYYVRCLNDRAMMVEEQDFFIARLKEGAPDAKVREIESDHTPFGSMPETLAGLVEEIVMELKGGDVEVLKS